MFKTINKKIKNHKEKSRIKKEEEIRLLTDTINERTLEFEKILEDYEDYVKDKKRFYIHLTDINHITIYYGTMTFHENHVEILPLNEGKTGIIPYNYIRKVRIGKCKINRPEKFLFSYFNSFDGIFIRLYLHNGDVYVIKIYNTVTSYQDPNHPYPNSMDPEGYLNFSSWFDTIGRNKMLGLTKGYNDEIEHLELKFLQNVLEIACKMNHALINRVQDLFRCEIEEKLVEFPLSIYD